jgi:hypothetical protein
MGQLDDIFIYSGQKAAKKEQLGSTWPIYKDFEIVTEEGSMYIYAPLRPPARPEEATIQIGQPDLNLDRMYSPLGDVPDLFLRFVALLPKRPISEEEMLDRMLEWVKSYGVLGSHAQTVGLAPFDNPKGLDYGTQHDRIQSFLEFRRALLEAAQCLRLYQAANANQNLYRSSQVDGDLLADKDALADVLSKADRKNKTLGQQRELALSRAQIIVHTHITQQCFPVLSQQFRRTIKNTYETAGFFQGWGFRSLLGAMYLQMMWLMMAGSNVKQCEGPGCMNIITFDPPQSPSSLRKGARGKYRTRSDKKYCSKNCKEKWRYHNVTKLQQQAEEDQ